MLDREQRRMVMKLFSDGMGVSEIAKKVGVSRPSVYRVIHSDFGEDAEIHALRKRLKKAKLEKSIREERKPFIAESKINKLEKAVDSIFGSLLLVEDLSSDVPNDPQHCPYCEEELEYVEETKGKVIESQGYRCHKCKKFFASS